MITVVFVRDKNTVHRTGIFQKIIIASTVTLPDNCAEEEVIYSMIKTKNDERNQ